MGLYPKQSDYRDYRFPSEHLYNRIYHVDGVNGDDTYSGLSWKKAKQTIMAAVNLARYLPGTTTIDDTKDHRSLVLVAPGHYNEAVLFSGYGIEICGCGHGMPGKDYGVSINYDGAVAINAAIAFSGSGITLRNLFVTVGAQAIPGIWIAGGDNNLIENVVIEGDGTMTYGIHAASLKGTSIRKVVVSGFATAGIWFEEGADRYAIQGEICDFIIHSDQNNADGILVDGGVVCWAYAIHHGFVDVLGGGAGAIGIDINYTGILFVTDNRVRAHTTAIDHEGEGAIWNHCSEGAAGAAAYQLIDEDDM